MTDDAKVYRVIDRTAAETTDDLERFLNEQSAEGYELVQVMESRGLQVVLRRRENAPETFPDWGAV